MKAAVLTPLHGWVLVVARVIFVAAFLALLWSNHALLGRVESLQNHVGKLRRSLASRIYAVGDPFDGLIVRDDQGRTVVLDPSSTDEGALVVVIHPACTACELAAREAAELSSDDAPTWLISLGSNAVTRGFLERMGLHIPAYTLPDDMRPEIRHKLSGYPQSFVVGPYDAVTDTCLTPRGCNRALLH